LFQYFASLIEGVSNDRLRLYLYHIPPIAVVHFSFPLIERLIAHYPGVVAGIKDSSGDWEHTRQLIECTLLAALRIGAAGCISGTANVSARLFQTIYTSWQIAEAEVWQTVVNKVRQVFLGYPRIPALKAIIARMRGESAWKNMQPPLLPLPESERAGLFEQLTDAGFDWPALRGRELL